MFRPVSNGTDDRVIRSRLLPGGDLVSAVLNRQLMVLADRGGGSGLVGRRWADLCADRASGFVGNPSPVPDDEPAPFIVERVARLDDIPRVAAMASKRGLQNPDLLFFGHRDGQSVIQAADAKFSVETARSKQVSPAVVQALLELGSVMSPLVGDLPEDCTIVPGVFLCPDFPLTSLMLKGRHGIVRSTADPREVLLVPVISGPFFVPLEGSSMVPVLAGIDALPIRIEESLLAGLYYFRLARSAVGCWLDSVRPLLPLNDHVTVDESAILAETDRRAADATSAFEMVLAWDADIETIRAQRAAIEQAAGVPIISKQLRTWIDVASRRLGAEPPSMNQVRRRLGAWFRAELRAQFGPLPPPIPDVSGKMREISAAGLALVPRLEAESIRIVTELLARAPAVDDGDDPAPDEMTA